MTFMVSVQSPALELFICGQKTLEASRTFLSVLKKHNLDILPFCLLSMNNETVLFSSMISLCIFMCIYYCYRGFFCFVFYSRVVNPASLYGKRCPCCGSPLHWWAWEAVFCAWRRVLLWTNLLTGSWGRASISAQVCHEGQIGTSCHHTASTISYFYATSCRGLRAWWRCKACKNVEPARHLNLTRNYFMFKGICVLVCSSWGGGAETGQ